MTEFLRMRDCLDITKTPDGKGINVILTMDYVSSGDIDQFIKQDGSIDERKLSEKIYEKLRRTDSVWL